MPKKTEKSVTEKSIIGNPASPEDQVRLKPVLGIKPGHYLAALYAIILFAVFFFVFLFPGLSKPGSVAVVKTEPHGAAVLLDGVYLAAAPCEVFIPKGHHTIELSLPGFTSKQIERDIKGRLFASALFPLKTELNETLLAVSPAEAFTGYAEDFAAWSFAGEPLAVYQIPLSLSEGAYRLGPAAQESAARERMNDTLVSAGRFAVTRAALRDLVRAKTLLDNNGLSPSPFSLLESAEDITGFLDKNSGAAIWLGALLNGESQSALTASAWYTGAAENFSAGKSVEESRLPLFAADGIQNTRAGGFLRLGLLDFVMLPGGLPLLSGNFPADTRVNDFYICRTVISAAAWNAFLDARPEWKKENTEALIKEGLAKEGYLEAASGSPAEGVSGISWYAAEAFCQWLGASLPPQMAGWEVKLSSEAEWEYAAKSGALDSGPSDLGNYWEWCEDPFVPLSFISAPETVLQSPEKSVRGGSWINSPGSVNAETRASLPPEFCSPFVSFRPVIAPVGAAGSAREGNVR